MPRDQAAPLFGYTPVDGAEQAGWTEHDAVEQRRLEAMHRSLLEACGQPAPREVWDPLTQLIYSLCSSRTKTPESHATLRALRERYHGWPTGPDSWHEVRWERLRDAPVAEIEETIQFATFADRKAPQLKATLERSHSRSLRITAPQRSAPGLNSFPASDRRSAPLS